MRSRLVALMIGRSPERRYSVHRGYVDAVTATGSHPVIVPAGPGIDTERTVELVLTCDALILSGGNDVDPTLYGSERGVGEKDPDLDRDMAEVAALSAAIETGRPVLGICRGIQLLTAALGGALIPDLPSAGYIGHHEEEREGEPVHGIVAETGSVAALVVAGSDRVNSIHHQAVKDPGPVLKASAWSCDGVIEAVEAPGALGIQWHPERLIQSDSRHLAPFEWLVKSNGW
jgi:putative glutamine amidotransferase